MKIVSTTLCGEGRVGELGPALESASRLCDELIVIDTAPLAVAPIQSIRATGNVTHARWPWSGRFDDARNECLRLARESGADWSCMLDSDERLVCKDPAAVRRWIEDLDPQVKIVCAFAADGSYQRERFFRGNIPQKWRFRTHESIDPGPGEQATIPPDLITWGELPKSGEMVITKSVRDAALIREDLKEYPNEPRLWFYLGNSLAHIGAENYEEAIAAYRKVAEVGIGEGCAWACFCAGRLYAEMSRLASDRGDAPEMWRLAYKALDCCSAGIHRCVSIAELHWLAAAMHHGIGNHKEAIAYSRQAALYGKDSIFFEDRHGFMVPHALRDGPNIIEGWALASMAAKSAPVRPGVSLTASQEGKRYLSKRVHLTVTGTGFRAQDYAAKCIESVARQTVNADHVYIAADDATLAVARAVKSNTIDGRGCSAFDNLVPLWRSLPPEEVVVWLDGDDWLLNSSALEVVARAHEAGAWVTYGQFQWSSTGEVGFAAQHDHSLPRMQSPWRATILRTFRAGLVQRIRDEDLRWPKLDSPGADALYDELRCASLRQLGYDASAHPDRRETFAGKFLDATLDQAVMLPCLEMAGAERSMFIPQQLAVYMDRNLATLDDGAALHEREALLYIRSRREYETAVSL